MGAWEPPELGVPLSGRTPAGLCRAGDMLSYCSPQELNLHGNGWRRTALSRQHCHRDNVLPGLHFRSRSMHIKKVGGGGETPSCILKRGGKIGNNEAQVPSKDIQGSVGCF